MRSTKRFLLTILYVAVMIIIGKLISSNSESSAKQSKPDADGDTIRQESRTFLETMRRFPWEPFQAAALTQNLAAARKYAKQLVQELYPFLLRAPPTPVNLNCPSPPIDLTDTIHQCIPLRGPRKVAVLLTFGYDVDLLDIYLHELGDLVDKIFLIEDPTPHNTRLRLVQSKPLIWETLKKDPRFSPFAHKIVHFIVEHKDGDNGTSIYTNENRQRSQLWNKFLEWNNQTQFFQDKDLLGFSDPDEIPQRNNVAFLKYCQLPSDPMDIGSWTPMNALDTLWQPDFSVGNHAYTVGIPTFWTFKAGKMYKVISGKWPGRQKGKTKEFLLGGIHLTRYLYPPHIMIKYLTCGECGWSEIKSVVKAGMFFRAGDLPRGVEAFSHLPWILNGQHRIANLTEFKRDNPEEVERIVKVPWYLQCNMNRYPSLKREWDPRLK